MSTGIQDVTPPLAQEIFPSLNLVMDEKGKHAHIGDIFQRFPQTLGPLLRYHDAVLRDNIKGSTLDAGEREFIAGFVSKLNACKFCTAAHDRITEGLEGDQHLQIEAAAENIDSAHITQKMKAILHFAKDLHEGVFAGNDGEALLKQAQDAITQAGGKPKDITLARHITGLFNLMNRMASGSGLGDYYNQVPTPIADSVANKDYYTDSAKDMNITLPNAGKDANFYLAEYEKAVVRNTKESTLSNNERLELAAYAAALNGNTSHAHALLYESGRAAGVAGVATNQKARGIPTFTALDIAKKNRALAHTMPEAINNSELLEKQNNNIDFRLPARPSAPNKKEPFYSGKMRALLKYITKLSNPDSMNKIIGKDAEAIHNAGGSDADIFTAIQIAGLAKHQSLSLGADKLLDHKQALGGTWVDRTGERSVA
jgi:uncharacterized peroxidase-related enzyme